MTTFIRNAIDAGLGKVVTGLDTIRLSARPLPEAPDGLSDAQAAPAMFNRQDEKEFLAQSLDDLRQQLKRGPVLEIDPEHLSSIVDAILHGNTIGVDDRKMVLEHVLVALSRTKPGSVLQKKLQDAVINFLNADLPHPPATYIGATAQFRSPDGSGNNPLLPDLGKAGTPYARSVQSTMPIPPGNLPSPDLVFDTLLRREKPGGTPHPTGVSSLMFSFAVLIIHSLFRTGADNFTNDTSSYLDLSPLYGHDLEAQMKVRRNDGTGRLYEDVFAENRLLFLPPAASALLVMFSRNHNYIVQKLYQINERGTFKDPEELKKMSPPSPKSDNIHINGHGHARYDSSSTNATEQSMVGSMFSVRSDGTAITSPTGSTFLGTGKNDVNYSEKKRSPLEEQDHILFNTARLINCGFFMNIIVSDYLGAILGLTRVGSSYSLNPLEEIRANNHQLVGRGQGNACSVEFNLLYRWHATLSAADEKWTETMMRNRFGGKDPNTLTWTDFATTMADEKRVSKDEPKDWKIRDKHGNELQRGKDGRFKDADLAAILHDATEHISGAFSARNTPEVLRIVEVMGIMQARKWGVCTTFKDWNPRKEIYEAARGLYGHPDNLELYVGMQAEEAKPVVPGAGLCPGYTISRAILADAVALT
ncbi:hypothetical protein FRC07_006027 [Ceratobasidium sp. 392]|nr:hypothetical protein FRC07_006027 [Ceratobasidium sp. 392]